MVSTISTIPAAFRTPKTSKWWVNRNNQRIGVAVADDPNGPWKRFDKPLIDAKPERRTAGIQMVYKHVTGDPFPHR